MRALGVRWSARRWLRVGRFTSPSLLLGQLLTSCGCSPTMSYPRTAFPRTDQLVLFLDPQCSTSCVPAAASTTSSRRWRTLSLSPKLMLAIVLPQPLLADAGPCAASHLLRAAGGCRPWSFEHELSSMCLGASAWMPRAVVPCRVARARTPLDEQAWTPLESCWISILNKKKEQLLQALIPWKLE
jgi:hypothetical protein